MERDTAAAEWGMWGPRVAEATGFGAVSPV